ncbi:MAG: hydrolase [Dehalococcoidia bacterium]|nr:MAG: hydrolase [Dehalococcoidia bacterium]
MTLSTPVLPCPGRRPPAPGPFRMLAVDLDGTLIGTDLVLRPAVRQAIRALLEAGVRVVLATGRMYCSARPFAQALGLRDPLICYQGALIREVTGAERVLRERPVPLALARAITRFAQAHDLTLHLYFDDRAYTARATPNSAYYAALNRIAVEEVGDLLPLLRRRPTKLVIISGPEGAAAIAAALAERWGQQAQVVLSHPRFAEVTARGVAKGSALRWLAGRLGIPRSQIVAIGDQQNDCSLLAAAGYAVAVGNAAPELKAMAHLIAPPVSEDGVAWAVRQLFRGVGGMPSGESQ